MTQSNTPTDSQGDAENTHQETVPAVYRSRVRSLLGVPEKAAENVVTGQSFSPVGFHYQAVPSPDALSMGPSSSREFIVEMANPMLDIHASDVPGDFAQTPGAFRPADVPSERSILNDQSADDVIGETDRYPSPETRLQSQGEPLVDTRPVSQIGDAQDVSITRAADESLLSRAANDERTPTSTSQSGASQQTDALLGNEALGGDSAEISLHDAERVDRASLDMPGVSEGRTVDSEPSTSTHSSVANIGGGDEQKRSSATEPEPSSGEVTSRQVEHSGTESVQRRVSDQVQESTTGTPSREGEGMNRVSLDMPGVSESPQSFPSLLGAPDVDLETGQVHESAPSIDEQHWPSDESVKGLAESVHRREQSAAFQSGGVETRASSQMPGVPGDQGAIFESQNVSTSRREQSLLNSDNAAQSERHTSPEQERRPWVMATSARQVSTQQFGRLNPVPPSLSQPSLEFGDRRAQVNDQAFVSRENSVSSDAQRNQGGGEIQTYREALEQVAQIRNAMMRQLPATSSPTTQNYGQESRYEDAPGRQPLPPPPDQLVVVQRPKGRSRAPRAFWDRRYLGHLRMRTLR